MAAKKQPWAVLVCRFSDDADPATVLVRDLPGLSNPDPTDPQTALDLFRMFFTRQGNNTFNAVRYFDEMSHGSIDLNDSQVFVVNVELTKAQAVLPDGYTPAEGAAYQVLITKAAQTAAVKQGVALQNFYGIVITSHYLLAMAQGGSIPGGAVVAGPVGWAGMDYRWVKNNGIQAWGQEMGHGYGLEHSRLDGSDEDYKDRWDIMSTRQAFSAADADYGMRGPGVNAANMRARGWLDGSRVWRGPESGFTDEVVTLRPLHRRDLPGPLCAEFPPADSGYLVEFRARDGWDAGIPRAAVLIHRFEGSNSYLMAATNGVPDLVKTDVFDPTGAAPSFVARPRAEVVNIDEASLTAQVRMSYRPTSSWSSLAGEDLKQLAVASNADGRLELFALGGNRAVYHRWQKTPNGGWADWSSLAGEDLKQLVIASNADGRLELFALGGNGAVYHRWQAAPGASWKDWSSLGGHDFEQVVVASDTDGRLELFALGGDGAVHLRRQTVPNGGWSDWHGIGGTSLQQIAVGRNADGRLELFALGGNGAAYHIWQRA